MLKHQKKMWKQVAFFFSVSIFPLLRQQKTNWLLTGIQRRLFNRSMACRGSGHIARPAHVDGNVFFFISTAGPCPPPTPSWYFFLPYRPARGWQGEVVLPLPPGLSVQCFLKMSVLLIWPKLRNRTKLGVQWIKNRWFCFGSDNQKSNINFCNFTNLTSVVCCWCFK